MKHKKNKHIDKVPFCDKLKSGKCLRDQHSCWFRHDTISNDVQEQVQNQQEFHKDHKNVAPPDQIASMVAMMSILCQKVDALETKFQEKIL